MERLVSTPTPKIGRRNGKTIKPKHRPDRGAGLSADRKDKGKDKDTPRGKTAVAVGRHKQVQLLNSLGAVLRRQGDYDGAKEVLMRALKLSKDLHAATEEVTSQDHTDQGKESGPPETGRQERRPKGEYSCTLFEVQSLILLAQNFLAQHISITARELGAARVFPINVRVYRNVDEELTRVEQLLLRALWACSQLFAGHPHHPCVSHTWMSLGMVLWRRHLLYLRQTGPTQERPGTISKFGSPHLARCQVRACIHSVAKTPSFLEQELQWSPPYGFFHFLYRAPLLFVGSHLVSACMFF